MFFARDSPIPPVTAAPMMRWLWFRPSVDRDELSWELTAMAAPASVGSRWPTSTRWGQRPLISSPTPFLPLVAAYVGAGSIQQRPESYHQLPVVDGMIKVPDGDGTRQVLLA